MRTNQFRNFQGRSLRQGAAFLLVLAGLVFSAILSPSPVSAQGLLSVVSGQSEATQSAQHAATNPTPAKIVKDDGLTVNLVAERALQAREELRRILENVPTLHSQMTETLASHGENGSTSWVLTSLLVVLAGLAAGSFALRSFYRWGRSHFAHIHREEVFERADKISYLFFRGIIMTVGLIIFVIVSGTVVLILNRGPEAANQTAIVAISTYVWFRFIRIVLFAVLAPDTPQYRLPSFSERDASRIYWFLVGGAAASFLALAVTDWMRRLGLPEDATKLAMIVSSMITMLALSFNAFMFRKEVGSLFLGKGDGDPALWRKLLAGGWHIVVIVYLVFAWLATTVRILLNVESSANLVAAPIQLVLIASAAYGLLILIIDRLLLPRLDSPEKVNSALADLQGQAETRGEEFDEASFRAEARAIAADNEAFREPFRALLDKGARIIVAFGVVQLLGFFWSGMPLTEGGTVLGSFIEVLLIMFLGYMAYQAVKILIDQQIAKESPAEQDEEAEIGGTGESRIATLLPIFRNFLLITIFVIVVMLVLSEIGVNIAPLFAGAGVVGLAVGFGAQTLIRDIFSGAFYLIDDAFRKGEYIDIGSAKGVVEKISIRSMQLRHHRGALTTVPFGEIQHVENFSRDWAMMKLAFRVTYDTDVEKMRKIIKRFGQELLADEYYGPMFLQPLKSQGIMSMEDSAMVARVKFMTKPGKQFELRKVVYAGLQDLFEKNGIKFAHRQVTVRVANADGEELDPKSVPPETIKAAAAAGAGAAGAIASEEEESGSGGNAADQL